MSEVGLDRTKTVSLILQCLDDNAGATESEKRNDELPLLGPGSTLDSMALVTLIVDVEQRLAIEYDAVVTLASEAAMSRRQSPFRTVGAFADYIGELVKESPANG